MDAPTKVGQHDIKGGKTILGKLFAYQEKTGMTPKEIGKLPYIQFVLGMIDAPQVDYDTKKKEDFGTKISDLPKDIQEQLR